MTRISHHPVYRSLRRTIDNILTLPSAGDSRSTINGAPLNLGDLRIENRNPENIFMSEGDNGNGNGNGENANLELYYKPLEASGCQGIIERQNCVKQGLEFLNQEEYEKAIEQFDRAIGIDPDYPGNYVAWNGKGRALAVLGKYAEALACFDRAIERTFDYFDLAETLVHKGMIFFKFGKYEEAVVCFEGVIECYDKLTGMSSDDPNIVWTWNRKGEALAASGRHGEALESFQKVLKLDPDNSVAINSLEVLMKKFD